MAVNTLTTASQKKEKTDLLAGLTQALSEPQVAADSRTCRRYARSTSGTSTFPWAVVYPQGTDQVQKVVKIAGQHNAGVYPISRGRNWGYGDACAPESGQIICDLSRMNRILEVNVSSAYAVIEPGVTQGQLYDYLQEHKLPLWMDSTGAGRDASLVGNTLDRGFGHTRYGDHCAAACGMKVVLPDATTLDTGFGRFPHAKAAHLYPDGVGPAVHGLFSQANFGIVTQLGLWLMPEPDYFCAFFIKVPRDQDLSPLVDRLASLRLRGLLTSTIHLGNDLRVISARRRYPWDRVRRLASQPTAQTSQADQGAAPALPASLRQQLRGEVGCGAWNVAGALYGTRATVGATIRELRDTLRPYKARFLDDRRLTLLSHAQRALAKVGRGQALGDLLANVRPTYGLLKGRPTDEPLRGAAWRVRGEFPTPHAPPADPRDIHAGLMWASPVLPAHGESAREVVDLLTPIYERHGFEPMITFTMINERAMTCVSNLTFDTRQTGEADRAQACHEELLRALLEAGYPPYRVGPSGYRALRETSASSSSYWTLMDRFKQAVDPGGVVSPGRYGLEPDRA